MEKKSQKKITKKIKVYANIMRKGVCRALHGAVIVALMCLSVWGFASVPFKTGWAAIWCFLASFFSMVVVLANIYVMGFYKS